MAHGVGNDESHEAVHEARSASGVQHLDDLMEANLVIEGSPCSWSCCGLEAGREAEAVWGRQSSDQGCADRRRLRRIQNASSCLGSQETTLSCQNYWETYLHC